MTYVSANPLTEQIIYRIGIGVFSDSIRSDKYGVAHRTRCSLAQIGPESIFLVMDNTTMVLRYWVVQQCTVGLPPKLGVILCN